MATFCELGSQAESLTPTETMTYRFNDFLDECIMRRALVVVVYNPNILDERELHDIAAAPYLLVV